jgi:thiamine kinase-like enzyme
LPSCLRPTHEIEARDVASLASECGDALRASDYYVDLTPSARAAYDSILERAETLGDALQKGPVTLLHHDCRADNLFWGDEKAPGGLIVLDWQMIGQGVGPLDLAWFVAGKSEKQATFTEHEEIVNTYWQSLTSSGVDADRYPLEAAWCDYLLGLVWSALVVVQLVKFGAPNPTLRKFLQRHVDSMMEVSAHTIAFERLV